MLASAGTVDGLGNGQTIRVVRTANFAFEGAAQVFVKRLSVEPRRVCIFHEAGSRGNCSRDSNADSRSAAKPLFHFLYAIGDGAHCAFVIMARSGDAMTVKFDAVAFEDDEFNFCAAQVHAHADGSVFRKSHLSHPLSNGEHFTLSWSINDLF